MENVTPWEIISVFLTVKIQYVLNGNHENPLTGITKKGSQQQKSPAATSCFRCRILYKRCENVHGAQARATRRGPPGSTIIIFENKIRFNNINNNHLIHGQPCFLPSRRSSWRGLLPPLRGGNSSSRESPVLAIPSYPALCRDDTTSWNDGRPSTQNMTSSCL